MIQLVIPGPNFSHTHDPPAALVLTITAPELAGGVSWGCPIIIYTQSNSPIFPVCMWICGGLAPCGVQARGLHLSQGQGGHEEDSWVTLYLEKGARRKSKESLLLFLRCSPWLQRGVSALERPRGANIQSGTAHPCGPSTLFGDHTNCSDVRGFH